MLIWNGKASGKRPILDSEGSPLDTTLFAEEELVHAILRWSALPGGSRHHWGTDFDIFDAAAVPVDYEIQLTAEEVEGDGPFAPMHDALDRLLEGSRFYRPYAVDRGGIAPERWHLSYRPLSSACAERFTLEDLAEAIEESQIQLKATVLSLLGEIWERYIKV